MQTGPGDKPIKPRKIKRAAPTVQTAPSEVHDVKSNADRRRAAPTVKRELRQIKRRQSEVKDTKGDRLPEKQRQKVVNSALSDLANHVIKNQKGYGTGEYTPSHPMVKNLAKIGLVKVVGGTLAKGEVMLAGESAPALKVLDQTTRPLHAVAGGIDAAVHHKNVLHAASRGIKNKDRVTFSKVLKDVGAPKAVQSVGGFALDVVADPTTYITFGAGSVARNAAKKAGEDAYKRALAQGLTEQQARRFGERAAKRAAKSAENAPKGATVKVAGKHVPGVTRATAPVGKVARKVTGTKPGQGAKGVVSDFNPGIAPAGATRHESDVATTAARTARAAKQRGEHAARQRAVALRKALGKDDAQVVDAIETGKIGSLPAHLQAPARELRDTGRYLHRVEKRAGIKGGTVGKRSPASLGPIPTRRVVETTTAKVQRYDVRATRKAIKRHNRGLRTKPNDQLLAAAEQGHKAVSDRLASLDKRLTTLEQHYHAADGLGDTQGAEQIMRDIETVNGERVDVATQLKRLDRQLRVLSGGRVRAPSEESLVARATESKTVRRLVERPAPTRRGRLTRPDVKPSGPAKGVKDYVPHYTNESLDAKAATERGAGSVVGKRTISPDFAKGREGGTLKQKIARKPGVYNEDAALGYLNRLMASAKSVSQAHLNRRLAEDLGRPVRPGKNLVYDPQLEGVFHLKGSDLTEVKDANDLAKLAKAGHLNRGGSYVVLNRDLVKRAHAIASPSGTRSATGAVFDKITGGFKFLATQPNPAFHIRNFAGDTHNAYTAQSGFRLPVNMAQAGKALRALKRDEEAKRTLGKTPKPVGRGVLGRSVKIDGKNMTYADLANEAAGVGAIRSGFTNQELPELLKNQGKSAKRVGRNIPVVGRAGRAVKRTIQSREDLPRLSTYIEGRKLGMSPEESARYSMGPHFDYANLTDVERKVRRFVPFYTFTARNIPYQAKVLITKPGKVAAYEKLREETAIAAGLGPGWTDGQSSWDQRNLGIPINLGGRMITITTGDPISDLNEFPTTFNPSRQADEWMQKVASMVNPVFKDPVELWANYSFFFRDQIRRKDAPLVAAPDWVGKWPAWAKRQMRVTKIVDKRTGKMVWAWDAKVNYIAHAVPGPPNTVQNLASSGTDRQGRGTPEKVAGALGVRATPYDPATTKINDLYDQLDKVQTKLGALSQQGIKRGNMTVERQQLNEQARMLERQIYQLSQKRGDKVLPAQGRPPRSRTPSLGGGLGGGVGGGLGGGV